MTTKTSRAKNIKKKDEKVVIFCESCLIDIKKNNVNGHKINGHVVSVYLFDPRDPRHDDPIFLKGL